ncbi:MAG TPA: NADH-quinone oxidoreductase subunit C, partial [Cupriavidus sp.]|nr:NADH-quinone oxidoreductase subunit C [Cupriavidus sp.]
MPRDVIRTEGVCGELIVVVRAAAIVGVLTFLRNDSNCQFKVLV